MTQIQMWIAGSMATLILLLGGATYFCWSQWQFASAALAEKQRIVDEQARIITAQDNVVRAEHTTTRVVEHTTERIMEAPHATDPISPDVAAAWSDGIDCLRALNAPRTSGNAPHVSGPCPSEAVSGTTPKRPTGDVQR